MASEAIILVAATVNNPLDAGITTVKGKVNELGLIVDNGTPAKPNGLLNGTAIPPMTLQSYTPV